VRESTEEEKSWGVHVKVYQVSGRSPHGFGVKYRAELWELPGSIYVAVLREGYTFMEGYVYAYGVGDEEKEALRSACDKWERENPGEFNPFLQILKQIRKARGSQISR